MTPKSQDTHSSKLSLRGSTHLLPFPKDEMSLRNNGRRLSFQDTLKYRQELEVNVQQAGGLERALSIEDSRSFTLDAIIDSLLRVMS
jgi:hypothetical protein